MTNKEINESNVLQMVTFMYNRRFVEAVINNFRANFNGGSYSKDDIISKFKTSLDNLSNEVDGVIVRKNPNKTSGNKDVARLSIYGHGVQIIIKSDFDIVNKISENGFTKYYGSYNTTKNVLEIILCRDDIKTSEKLLVLSRMNGKSRYGFRLTPRSLLSKVVLEVLETHKGEVIDLPVEFSNETLMINFDSLFPQLPPINN